MSDYAAMLAARPADAGKTLLEDERVYLAQFLGGNLTPAGVSRYTHLYGAIRHVVRTLSEEQVAALAQHMEDGPATSTYTQHAQRVYDFGLELDLNVVTDTALYCLEIALHTTHEVRLPGDASCTIS